MNKKERRAFFENMLDMFYDMVREIEMLGPKEFLKIYKEKEYPANSDTITQFLYIYNKINKKQN